MERVSPFEPRPKIILEHFKCVRMLMFIAFTPSNYDLFVILDIKE